MTINRIRLGMICLAMTALMVCLGSVAGHAQSLVAIRPIGRNGNCGWTGRALSAKYRPVIGSFAENRTAKGKAWRG